MKEKITVIGAGLVGSLLSIFMAKRGYDVQTFEGRSDPRHRYFDGGRSINLALSHRGLKALEAVGLLDKVDELCIPMKGRMVHDLEGNTNFQPYGKEGQFINSVSRGGLNKLLLEEAEKAGVEIHFNHKCLGVDDQKTQAYFKTNRQSVSVDSDFILAADGAFSAVRNAYMKTPRFNYEQHYITAGYKELNIPAKDGDFAIEPNALHIWPRGKFMLIALPNLDKSFTVTLFLPFEGEKSFEKLKSDKEIMAFFSEEFPDTLEIMPDLLEDFRTNPTSGLVTIRCFPWAKDNTLLIGDAAHAIVPFYGQGMNAGFEDCLVLNQLIDEQGNISPQILQEYQNQRKKDAEAIADLALYNFIEMRDKVADPQFLLQKKIEAHLHDLFPEDWIPLYSMVTFSDMTYSEAYEVGKKQQEIMNEVLAKPQIEEEWQNLDFKEIVDALKRKQLDV